jgi:hypothetical protein
MQSRLRSNRAHLQTQGIEFVDLWAKEAALKEYRNAFKSIIESHAADERALSRLSGQLRNIVQNERSAANALAVMSFENILGGFDLTRSKAPYPHAEAAIRHVVEAFPEDRVRIFLSIRSLDRFLESGYVQLVSTRRETRNFKQYLKDIDLSALSWAPAVRAIESIVGANDLFVWEYERFFSDEHKIWNALLNGDDGESALINPAKKSNQSLSAKGLKYLRSINRVATPADAKKFRFFVKDKFGTQRGLKPPALLDDLRRSQLIDAYEKDRKELADLLVRQSHLR